MLENILEESFKQTFGLRRQAQEHLRKQPRVVRIPVKYIEAINPWGEKVLVSEADIKKAESLGLSLRRIK